MAENNNEMSRSNRKQGEKKRKKRKHGCLRVFLVILLLVGGVLAYAYYQLRQTTDTIHMDITDDRIVHSSRENGNVNLNGETPFSVLLLGIDTGDMGRVDKGRSDTMMVMAVNPNDNRTTLVSIPRDTLTEIVGRGTQDKINHAYAFGGAAMSVNSVQNLLDIPIDYYVSVNMEGIQQIVDAVGGVNITPTATFSQSGFDFVEGQSVQMSGEMALAYSRMRKQDGDYARQGRQREVVMATLSKVASFSTIMNYQSVLQTMEDNVETNLTFDDMVSMFMNYREAIGDTEELQLSGSGTTIDGIYYEIIPDEELNKVSETLKGELGILE